jgi:hypothetical protein
MSLAKWLSAGEASVVLSIRKKTLYDYTARGLLPKNSYFRIGRLIRFNPELVALGLAELNEERDLSRVRRSSAYVNPEKTR